MRKAENSAATRMPWLTVGIDVGDRRSRYAMVNRAGKLIEEGELVNTAAGLAGVFEDLPAARVALETGAQSGWIARALEEWGHEVLVGNARELRGIWQAVRKNDRRDAAKLARYARADPALLHATRVRSQQAQLELSELRARDALVRARTLLVNAARGLAKTHGERLPKTSTKALAARGAAALSAPLAAALKPLLGQIEALSERIQAADRAVKGAAERDPDAKRLLTVPGVGPLTALSFVRTIEDPHRFRHSREVGPYLGLTPRQAQSGARDPQLPISKAGDVRLRRLLVQCAHHILGPFGQDSELRRWALALALRGGASGRKRAVTALARKLAVVLHRLWVDGRIWQAFPAAA
jgi:transposase